MTAANPRPVLFFAFANDRGEGGAYLRNLPEEARRVGQTLKAAAAQCEIVLKQNVTAGDVFDTFQEYRDRIALFHYAGHANGYQLLLESAEGRAHAVGASGLAAFLGQQRGLRLVFLNGCSTRPQVDALLGANVAAVVATARAIDDRAATEFAARFYAGLASGASIGVAFHESEGAARAAGGSLYRDAAPPWQKGPGAPADEFPWSLTPHPGARDAADWNIPAATGDWTFGLPPLPPLDRPDAPFRHLLPFAREHARIFFGRGRQVRALHAKLTDPAGPPVVLLYGQAGTGKSSLLDAGLLPRLESAHEVRYLRRRQEGGLLDTLRLALLPEGAELPVIEAWHAKERATGRPLVVVLDQVEEAYTRPNENNPNELAELLDAVRVIFADPDRRPRGRLVLSFRKEWLPEIEKHLGERHVPRAEVFLERLDRAGVAEAVGLSAEVREQFRLSVDPALPERVAGDLLEDPNSPVAPTLQVLLATMWDRAKRRNNAPAFDTDLYDDLRRQGLHLGDFLDRQLAALRVDLPGAVASGLALDVLAFHTTALGTAGQRGERELLDTYGHQAEVIGRLVQRCKDLYLLTDWREDQARYEPTTRLAHDTLAPLVRKRFGESDAPGQRARRLLDNRSPEWVDRDGPPLDTADLAVVESGVSGTRRLSVPEERLVGASRHRREVRKRWIRRACVLGAVAAATILTLAAIAIHQGKQARTNAQSAMDAQRKTQETLARSFARSIGQRPGEEPLNSVEVDALWNLAALDVTDEPVRLAFLRQILSDPAAASRLRSKLPFAVHAAIGLDPERRDRAVREVLLPTLRGEGATLQVRLATVEAGIALSVVDIAFLEAAVAVEEEAVRSGLLDSDPAHTEPLCFLRVLTSCGERGDEWDRRKEAVRRIEKVMTSLLVQISQRGDWNAMVQLITRMSEGGIGPLAECMQAERDGLALRKMVPAVAALAPRLDEADAARLAAPLVERIQAEKDVFVLREIFPAVAALAPRLGGADAARLATPLVERMRTEKDGYAVSELALAVAALAPRLGEADSVRMVTSLTGRIRAERDGYTMITMVPAVAALAPRLGGADAARLAAPLVERIQTKKSEDTSGAAPAVAALAPRLGEADAARLATPLVERIQTERDGTALARLASAVAALVDRLGEADAARIAERTVPLLVERVRAEAEGGGIAFASSGVAPAAAALSVRLGGTDAACLSAAAAAALVKRIRAEKDGLNLSYLSPALGPLVPRLSEVDATQLAASLVEGMRTDAWRESTRALGLAVAALAPRLGKPHATRLASDLIKRMQTEKDTIALRELARAVAALAAQLGEGGAAGLVEGAAAPLIKRMGTEKNVFMLSELGLGVAALAAQLGEGDAARLVERAATPLIEQIRVEEGAAGHIAQGGALAALAPRLGAADATRLASTLVEQMLRGAAPGVLKHLRSASVTITPEMGRHAASVTTRWTDQLFALERIDPRGDPRYQLLTSAIAPGQPLIGTLPPADARRWFDRLLRHPHAALALARGDDRTAWSAALDRLPLGNDPVRFAEWLKAPTCVGLIRGAVLKHAGRAAGGREFRTAWEFREWAREHRPDIDFSAPPRI